LLATDYSKLADNAKPPLNGVDPRLTCIHRRRFFFASTMLGSRGGFGAGNGSGRGVGGSSLSRTARSFRMRGQSANEFSARFF
jgi:hypothetical protein